MTTLDTRWQNTPADDGRTGTSTTHVETRAEPYRRIHWTDPVTGARGYLVLQTLVSGLATGGTRMRPGCTLSEVEDLARGMAAKTAVFGLPVGGAKGGIDFDPQDPRATGVLERFFADMKPWLDAHWVTAEDLGVTQQRIDDAFAAVGLGQSFHAAIQRSSDPAATLERVRTGLEIMTDDGCVLGDVIGGYGVAQACLGVFATRAWMQPEVAIQGVGTMGGAAAFYLHEAGVHVVAMADALGTLYDPNGLDVPALLDLRDDYGTIDRTRVPATVTQLPRESVLAVEADILVPAAISYAITPANVDDVAAAVIVEAANTGVTREAEALLAKRGVMVIPDIVANTGAAAWAWWLLFGWVGTDPAESFDRLHTEMRTKVARLLEESMRTGTSPRETAWSIASANRAAMDNRPDAIIP
ncbi:Glu/Leu/Phe/Val dehydrogenase dimerization domain-containing protein [Ruania halotolerans]|uniref:Glu/Leu/Phe/Val dehydrogenase dimerization domain-containing protein n=1 Tax=Ruania halotolerans TaxID=2897773 RepID=UPI001E32383A|nr:Glu/Leu/Phe/Val dehydrogenase dimerization domain-containing protein [Ruania halotolerans]UFU05376.1 glutamate dehydrogenase [Ruania halotolerans]